MTTQNTDAKPLIDQLIKWISIDSTSGNEAAFLVKLEEHFNSLGFQCYRQYLEENRWNLLCLYPSKASVDSPDGAAPKLFFTTHVDCVPPFLGPSFENDDGGGIVRGRGACDTKGGIVAMTEASLRLIAEGLDDLGFLFVVGEEVDHRGAKFVEKTPKDELFSRAFRRAKQLILCEPTQNRVTHAQKGILKIEVAAHGRACHSAYPQRGDSAINKLLDLLQRWRNLDLPQNDILGPTTLNIGRIEGGVAANVVPAEASAELLIRAVSPVNDLLNRFKDANDANLDLVVPSMNDPVFFEPPEGVQTANVAFNTDASYLQSLGPIWLVGPGDIEVAHSDNEHITVQSLLEGVELYVELGRRVLKS